MEYNVTFTTYDEYTVEADSESEAQAKAYDLLRQERLRSVASTHYDEVEIEEVE